MREAIGNRDTSIWFDINQTEQVHVHVAALLQVAHRLWVTRAWAAHPWLSLSTAREGRRTC